MAARGVLSSWLTMPMNSARILSSLSSGVMSWMVVITETTSPSSEKTGVALMMVLTDCPLAKLMTTSSARTVSPVRIAR